MGQRRLGATQCIDKDECEKPGLCENGATCINLSDSRHFRCSCAPGWVGKFCREPAPAGNILYGGRDFIIVFVFCILSLLGNFLFLLFCRNVCRHARCFVCLFSINPSSWMLVSFSEKSNRQSLSIHQSFCSFGAGLCCLQQKKRGSNQVPRPRRRCERKHNQLRGWGRRRGWYDSIRHHPPPGEDHDIDFEKKLSPM